MYESDHERGPSLAERLGKSTLLLLASPAKLPIEPIRALVVWASDATLAATGGLLEAVENLAGISGSDGVHRQ